LKTWNWYSNNIISGLELIQKVEGQVARVTAIRILIKEEGFLTINEDKSLRVLLRRDTGENNINLDFKQSLQN
jgi:hypothetical protein